MTISEAIDFVCNNFFNPTIEHERCDKKTQNIAINCRGWARSFTHVGSLYDYLRFLNGSADQTVHTAQAELGLKTITELITEYEHHFAQQLNNRLTPSGLQIGQNYPTQVIHALCESYDLRSGGILPVKSYEGVLNFTAVKATLEGGSYPNEWLKRGEVLKYYMKARSGIYKEEYPENSAIINSTFQPVLVFARNKKSEKFSYFGEFNLTAIHTNEDKTKWFELTIRDQIPSQSVSAVHFSLNLDEQVQRSSELDPSERRRRLAEAPRQPTKRKTSTFVFSRNPDVIAEVLHRANGICECCGKPAPFDRKTNGSPFLEVHHIIPLSEDGPDTVDNAAALCPNCHRNEHFGQARLR